MSDSNQKVGVVSLGCPKVHYPLLAQLPNSSPTLSSVQPKAPEGKPGSSCIQAEQHAPEPSIYTILTSLNWLSATPSTLNKKSVVKFGGFYVEFWGQSNISPETERATTGRPLQKPYSNNPTLTLVTMLTRWVPEDIGWQLEAGTVAFLDSPEAMWTILFACAISGPLIALLFRSWFTALRQS